MKRKRQSKKEAYENAKKMLYDGSDYTAAYKKYQEMESEFKEAQRTFLTESNKNSQNEEEVNKASAAMEAAMHNWIAVGKQDIGSIAVLHVLKHSFDVGIAAFGSVRVEVQKLKTVIVSQFRNFQTLITDAIHHVVIKWFVCVTHKTACFLRCSGSANIHVIVVL